MNGSNSVETQNLSDKAKFRLNEINKIKDYFNSEIREWKLINKKLSKYIAAFNYIDKTVIVLSATFGTLSVVSHATVVGIPVGLSGASLTVVFSLTTGIIKKLLKKNKKEKEKTQ